MAAFRATCSASIKHLGTTHRHSDCRSDRIEEFQLPSLVLTVNTSCCLIGLASGSKSLIIASVPGVTLDFMSFDLRLLEPFST